MANPIRAQLNEKVAAIILAAGKGTRMRSEIPKVLHKAAGKTLLQRVTERVCEAGVSQVLIVVGGEIQLFLDHISAFSFPVTVCQQLHRRGTGDAVASAAVGLRGARIPHFAQSKLIRGGEIEANCLLICAGDVPNLKSKTVVDFLEFCRASKTEFGVLAMKHPTPKGYGRILTDEGGNLIGIVEEKDATADQKLIDICNTGLVFARADALFNTIDQLTTDNAQGEYYLTDCFAIARKEGLSTKVFVAPDWSEFEGVNTPEQLAQVEQLILAGC